MRRDAARSDITGQVRTLCNMFAIHVHSLCTHTTQHVPALGGPGPVDFRVRVRASPYNTSDEVRTALMPAPVP